MNKLSKIAAMSAFLGLLASCSSDNPIAESSDNGTADTDQTVYVKVAVRGESSYGSRANGQPDDFASGDGNESVINSIYFVFYDDNGNIAGNIVTAPLETESIPTDDPEHVEKVYENTVAVTLLKGQAKPTKVMCYLNPVSLNDIQKPLDVIQTVSRETVQDADGYFPMSNSVYYENETSTAPQIAVSVSDKVYDTKEEAEAAPDDKVVKIYVERRAARLKFAVAEGAKNSSYTSESFGPDKTQYTLKFNIEGWDVNAQASHTYIVKSFREKMLLQDQFLPIISPMRLPMPSSIRTKGTGYGTFPAIIVHTGQFRRHISLINIRRWHRMWTNPTIWSTLFPAQLMIQSINGKALMPQLSITVKRQWVTMH